MKQKINSVEELKEFTHEPLPETFTWELYNKFGVQEITTDTATGQNISSKYIKRW